MYERSELSMDGVNVDFGWLQLAALFVCYCGCCIRAGPVQLQEQAQNIHLIRLDLSCFSLAIAPPPFPQIDIIRAVAIVWRVRGKTIRSVLCNIVCNNCAQCDAHTLNRLTVLWIGLCLTGPISLCLDSFLYCVLLCVVCMLRFVTRWGGPGGIEAYP